MKKKQNLPTKQRRKSLNTKQFTKRLTSYTAAAGLGAFGYGQAANAVVLYTDIPDEVHERGDEFINFNVDGLGDDDLHFRNSAFGGGVASGRFLGLNGTEELASTLDGGNPYYVRAFELDEQIGPISTPENYTYTVYAGIPPDKDYGILKSDEENFGDPNNPQFAGFLLMDPEGGQHFGWARIRIEPCCDAGGQPTVPLIVTLFDFAYETEVNTPIIAGDRGPLPGDFDGDGDVDSDDLSQWKGDFGVNGDSDANGDGDSDGADFLKWQENFTGPAALITNVPEPTTLALLAAGGGAFALRRRRRTT